MHLGAVVTTALAFMLLPAHGKPPASDDFLPPEQAFQPSGRVLDARSVELQFEVAPGYYLYREQFHVAASGATLGVIAIPRGEVRFDENFGKNVETHRGLLRITVPVQHAAGPFRLDVRYQGCADKGLCYAPAQWQAEVSLAAFGGTAALQVLPADAAAAPLSATSMPVAAPAPAPWPRWALFAGAAVIAVAALLGWRHLSRRRKNTGAA